MYKNFTLAELTASSVARSKGIDNTPPAEAIAHLGELVGAILQPLRDAWGRPIKVTSGYRCPNLNKAVGGVANSAHQYGYAVDVQPQSMADFGEFVNFITAWVQGQGIKFDQIIIEKSSTSRWVHIGVRDKDGRQRMQLFGMAV